VNVSPIGARALAGRRSSVRCTDYSRSIVRARDEVPTTPRDDPSTRVTGAGT